MSSSFRPSANLQQYLGSLVERGPIFFEALPSPHWVVTDAELARQVLSDSKLFSSRYGTGLLGSSPVDGQSLNLSDGQEHRIRRQQVERWWSQGYHEARTRIRQKGQQLLADFHQGDFVAQVATPWAWDSLLRVLGVPLEDPQNRPAQGPNCAQELDPERGPNDVPDGAPCDGPSTGTELFELSRRLIFSASRREFQQANTALLQCLLERPLGIAAEWAPLDRAYLERLLLVTGWVSTSALLSRIMASGPQASLNTLLGSHAPISRIGRQVTLDTELAGQVLHAGDRILILLSCTGAELAFGWGPHRCLGEGLARFQATCLLEEMKALDHVEVGAPRWWPSSFVLGFESLPVRIWRRSNEL